ncbi:MAG: glycosyltransferase family 2 protein [Methanobacterium sp. ERen5]|nr:MAG: glycosyltransferase family 2 protein [Methanobacterium sp. ERen5]
MRTFVVVPAYNEEKTIEKVLHDLSTMGFEFVVVDDGSMDGTNDIVKKFIEENNHGFICRHLLNRGLGAAIKTGIEASLEEDADVIVTFDADGQHDPNDIYTVINPIINQEADVCIGTRDFDDMPRSKKYGNSVMNLITMIFYGIKVGDSQSGLRAFNKKAAKAMIINARDYGVSSEIIGEIKRHNLELKEVPMKTIYTDYTMKKGTNLFEGLKILSKLIFKLFK